MHNYRLAVPDAP